MRFWLALLLFPVGSVFIVYCRICQDLIVYCGIWLHFHSVVWDVTESSSCMESHCIFIVYCVTLLLCLLCTVEFHYVLLNFTVSSLCTVGFHSSSLCTVGFHCIFTVYCWISLYLLCTVEFYCIFSVYCEILHFLKYLHCVLWNFSVSSMCTTSTPKPSNGFHVNKCIMLALRIFKKIIFYKNCVLCILLCDSMVVDWTVCLLRQGQNI